MFGFGTDSRLVAAACFELRNDERADRTAWSRRGGVPASERGICDPLGDLFGQPVAVEFLVRKALDSGSTAAARPPVRSYRIDTGLVVALENETDAR